MAMKKKKIEKKPKAAPASKEEAPKAVVPVKSASGIETLRGVRDTLPQEAGYWKWIFNAVETLGRDYHFSWIETPIIEPASLFIRPLGKQTDVVEKEMYRFTDQGGEDVVLRPEGTAPIARAYVNHGMVSMPQPVKLYYWGPMFRYDRPQSGRYRQFHQFGFETLGEVKPVVDAELIMLAYNMIREMGIPATVQINSIGSVASRENYKTQLLNYYRPHRSQLCENCKRRITKNPLRLLDCKEEGCVLIRTNAPHLVDWIDEESKAHFMKVLEYLDEAEVPYILNPYLVRGFDYYNRTVFEIVAEDEDERSQNALGGGGRYDGLIEVLGGRPTPAAGFAMGVERVILALKARNIEPPPPISPDIFLAQLGEQAKRRSLVIFDECRRAGFQITQAFVKDSIKAQMELSNKLGVRFTLILGQKEVLDGTIIIRDMESGVQEIVDQRKLVTELKKKLTAVAVDAPSAV
ncbi:MAG: histidine--tRNA ligase [bacterium]|nr:histidine--tRNA ligase [bacterium]